MNFNTLTFQMALQVKIKKLSITLVYDQVLQNL